MRRAVRSALLGAALIALPLACEESGEIDHSDLARRLAGAIDFNDKSALAVSCTPGDTRECECKPATIWKSATKVSGTPPVEHAGERAYPQVIRLSAPSLLETGAQFDIELYVSYASPERIKILNALGAELILTDPFEGSDGAIMVARELTETHPDRYWYANQYNNPANWQAHYRSTGPEIVQQTAHLTGSAPTHFIAGLGTSGTLMGTGRYLRDHVPGVRLIAFQPDSPFHGLEGLKHMPSAIRPAIFDPHLADENLEVRTEDAYAMTRRLARAEGLFVGISSGAAAVAALKLAGRLESGVVVTVFPDGGYKYLSDRLWEEER